MCFIVYRPTLQNASRRTLNEPEAVCIYSIPQSALPKVDPSNSFSRLEAARVGLLLGWLKQAEMQGYRYNQSQPDTIANGGSSYWFLTCIALSDHALLLQTSDREEPSAPPTIKPASNLARDQQVLEKASQDIAIIREAQASEEPLEVLRNAYNLLQAYQDFLQIMKEEYNRIQPWANWPQSKVSGYSKACVL